MNALQKRVIICWIVTGVLGMMIFSFIGEATWLCRLLAILIFEILAGAWFSLILYAQTKAIDPTSEGEAFRGPMPVWRAVFWTFFAAGGVFCCQYWLPLEHSWQKALFGALFCSFGIGGFAFFLNWIGGDDGKAWARKYARQLLTLYAFALSVSTLLKMWSIFSRPK